MRLAKVLIEHERFNLDVPFDYLILDDLNVIKGIRVTVEFNNQNLVGYVLDVSECDSSLQEINDKYGYELKPIKNILDEEPLFNDEILKIAYFMQENYVCNLISCIKTMLPPSLKPKSVKNRANILQNLFVQVVDYNFDSLTKKQCECLEYLHAKEDCGEFKNQVPYSDALIKTLVRLNRVEIINKEHYRLALNDQLVLEDNHILNLEQDVAVKAILNQTNQFYLLQGVTGSGKTEVYIHIAKHYLNIGKTVLILVPEISLTPQMVSRFKLRISENIAIFHSGLSSGEKYDEYRKIKRNQVQVVIGARSAIFAPLLNLGIIIIDEEHSETYKQDNNPAYIVHDIATFRANYHNCKIVFGSATPCLETKARAVKGLYSQLFLNKRISSHGMPKTVVVNMNDEYRHGNYSLFSRVLSDSLRRVIENKEQAIILLNRRGYSKQVMCKSCGHIITCPSCDISLTYHKDSNSLKCHYCQYETKYPNACSECGSKNLRNSGTGTQRVQEELEKIIPAIRVVRMDLDTVTKKDSHKNILQDFEEQKYDVLLGTQMIAKGLDMPNVTLVGVINADVGLDVDFRSSERIFQLLEQVCGRSGRGEKSGIGIIQSTNVEHYAIQLAARHDYEKFYELEMKQRRELRYPPYRYLASILLSGKNLDRLTVFAHQVKDFIKDSKLANLDVLGPVSPYISKYLDLHRLRLLIKFKDKVEVIKLLNILKDNQKSSSIKMTFDINPYNII